MLRAELEGVGLNSLSQRVNLIVAVTVFVTISCVPRHSFVARGKVDIISDRLST